MSATIRQVMIRGRVQGVGYRAWVEERALAQDLEGWVRNRRDGSVEALFAGPPEVVTDMVSQMPARAVLVARRRGDGRCRPSGRAEVATAGRAVFGASDDLAAFGETKSRAGRRVLRPPGCKINCFRNPPAPGRQRVNLFWSNGKG